MLQQVLTETISKKATMYALSDAIEYDLFINACNVLRTIYSCGREWETFTEFDNALKTVIRRRLLQGE